jgi:signal peptidase I
MLAVDKVAMDNREGRMIKHYGLIYRPVDKRENYIKRCVGIPGDKLEIINSILYINGKKAFVAEHQNLQYSVSNFQNTGSTSSFTNMMYEQYGLEPTDTESDPVRGWRGDYSILSDNGNTLELEMNLTRTELNKLKHDFPNAKFKINVPNKVEFARRNEALKNGFNSVEKLKAAGALARLPLQEQEAAYNIGRPQQSVSVTAGGKTYYFKDQNSANLFRQKAGIK